MMKQFFVPALLLLSSYVFSQKLAYTLRFPNAVHHEARITLEVTGSTQPLLLFRMSRSSPGRYATHEFGKNVYDLEATDAAGKVLPISRTDGDAWQVAGGSGTVRLSYTLFANYADGTYAGIDPASIHLNMPATLMWVKGLEAAPVQVSFEVPDTSFSIATQLKPTADKNIFTAPNLQYLMDSPVKMGNLTWRQWPVSNGGTTQTMRLALEADATPAQADTLASRVKRIAAHAKAVFGEYPAFDYGTYTFLASINPYVHGDGMEHRNSTMISIPDTFSMEYDNTEVFAHEFFHSWNVERIRPKTLEPFSFEKSNLSNELWCAEGFTQYYGGLLLVRAGLDSDTAYRTVLSGLINSKLNTPGATLYTPIQSSNEAVFTDAGRSIDATNFPNIFTSYYTYGGALALALDLSLRQQGRSLDHFMQQMWKAHGKPEKPYTVADMQTALAAITTPAFAKTFFDNYVYAPGKPDYEKLLAPAGFVLKKTVPGKAWAGRVRYMPGATGITIAGNTVKGTPLYEAGLDADDVLLTMDNKFVRRVEDIATILNGHKPGDDLPVSYLHRGRSRQTTVRLVENPSVSALPYEQAGLPVTEAIRAFRNSWLGAR